ncbi:MAG TPA: hypothetical protein VJ770_18030 [Stellaceae bacterium]|nr:hypothetical protein [Stellaceae bacterium]
MSWYVSYQSGRSVVMRVFRHKDHAICAARHLLDAGLDDRIEVGPMQGLLEGNILNADDLRQIKGK